LRRLRAVDALEINDSAVKVLGDETLRSIARELVEAVRRIITIDWMMRENVRAQLRALVKRILKPTRPKRVAPSGTWYQTILEQAALLSPEWTAA
jgi:type I restriction enzyme, R subunit